MPNKKCGPDLNLISLDHRSGPFSLYWDVSKDFFDSQEPEKFIEKFKKPSFTFRGLSFFNQMGTTILSPSSTLFSHKTLERLGAFYGVPISQFIPLRNISCDGGNLTSDAGAIPLFDFISKAQLLSL